MSHGRGYSSCRLRHADRLPHSGRPHELLYRLLPGHLGIEKAVLEYQVLAQYETNGKCLSHLRIQLQTGRHHQIRFSSPCGCPLFGDRKYNPDGIPVSRLYLCACQLDFLHPSTGKLLHFEIQPFFYEEFDKSSPS